MRSSSKYKEILISALIIVSGLFTAAYLNRVSAANRPALPEHIVDNDLEVQGSRLKGFAFGAEGLIADWYWMRALQYLGDKILARPPGCINIDDLTDLNPRLLYPYLDVATDLDPNFITVYEYGAIVLPAVDPQMALALANKGIKHNPQNWKLYQHLGYIYWRLDRYDEAAAAYETGSKIEGAAPFLGLMAGALRIQGGSRKTARAIYTEMAKATDEAVRETAELRLKQLDFFDERDAIDNILADFKGANGRCASAFGEIATKLFEQKLPGGRPWGVDRERRLIDPTGTPYILDKENCSVKLDAAKTKIPSEKMK